MILPEGKSKKYIKTVIGIYVVFTIISPIISNINNTSIDLNKYLNTENKVSLQTSSVIDTNKYIEDVYQEKLKTDIKANVLSMDYEIEKINLEIETKDEVRYGEILKLEISVSKKQDEPQNNINIEKIVIGEEKKEEINISDEEKENIKQFLSDVYCIEKEKVVVK